MSNLTAPADANIATPNEINSLLDQLNMADFTMAKINEDLKDADRRQEVGMRLVQMLHEATDQGLKYNKIKLASKAGTLKLSFEFPSIVFRDLLGGLSAESQ